MNIVSLFNSFINHFDDILVDNLSFHDLESKIMDANHRLNLDTLKCILEYIDLEYKHSKKRKDKYYVWGCRERTLITSLGLVKFNKTYYRSKHKINGKYEFFSYIEDYLGLDKWVKMTLSAEVNLINNSVNNGMSWASKNTIPNYEISRQTISTKIKNINYNFTSVIPKASYIPKTLYIEADEVHANLQRKKKLCKKSKKKNRIVPVILTHEGHKEHFVTKKELHNKHYIASSILKTNLLWNEAYKYLDSRYELDKVQYLFISGDGAPWIKQFAEAFPNAIYVYDKFHYRMNLNIIFKKHPLLTKIADTYLRNKDIEGFKTLVKFQLELYPYQHKRIMRARKTILNNIDGIINQYHKEYKCPCSMEGHISNMYARHITSRPHAYSVDGLENTVQLLTMKANNIELTPDIYHKFKYGTNTYKKLNLEKFVSEFRLQANKVYEELSYFETEHDINNFNFSNQDNYRLNYFLNKRI